MEASFSTYDFTETRKRFESYLQYDRNNPYTYEEWLFLSSDKKLAALFCVYYSEIIKAWHKLKTNAFENQTDCTKSSDAVELTLQYLSKNVSKIENDKKRYTPQYIYTVVYHAIGTPHRLRVWTTHIRTNLTKDETGKELNLYDMFSKDISADLLLDPIRQQMWNDIVNMGIDAVSVAIALLKNVDEVEDRSWSPYSSRKCVAHYKKLQKENKLNEVLDELKQTLFKYIELLGLDIDTKE